MSDNHVDLDGLFVRFLDKGTETPLYFAEKLAKIGTDEVKERLLEIVGGEDMENAYLAVKALSLMENREDVLDSVFAAIHRPANRDKNGGLVSLLEDFDLSEHFVDVFRVFLFGNFKASTLAGSYLDYMEFDITPRTLKKAEKHWNHFLNNASSDEAFELKRTEGEEILREIKALLDD
ncbi:MAG: HEAT repeat domain-containing protein [Lunatimonas sp.]|uniref:HEAT repeat domain-containing protein n=1 Tax=Lunatimonas sp. TaxID=2060141 RepID=UPI00263AA724|nr:HEAT repeat domain-containing protein [Lunatimonas sp.]MCC5937074.1 HEAT repeat domain-containing protein [Lunatimonas sp.]